MLFPVPPRDMTGMQFVARFGGVYEHSPWIAEKVYRAGLTENEDSVAGLAAAFEAVLGKATHNQLLGLVLEHPDLAGRAAVAGELTIESTGEQQSAGLDRLSESEYRRFKELNAAYRERFGFPFIKAVRGAGRAEILDEFERRLGNDRPTEFRTAIEEINRIALLRLEAIAGEQE